MLILLYSKICVFLDPVFFFNLNLPNLTNLHVCDSVFSGNILNISLYVKIFLKFLPNKQRNLVTHRAYIQGDCDYEVYVFKSCFMQSCKRLWSCKGVTGRYSRAEWLMILINITKHSSKSNASKWSSCRY